FLRSPSHHHPSAPLAAFGTQVDDVVRALDHVEVMLDQQNSVPDIYEAAEDIEEPSDVVEMQPRGRLVEHVERAARRATGKLARQLDALRLPSRQRRARLAEADVFEAHLPQRLQPPARRGHLAEDVER